jgi:hypothetical protein
MRLKIQCDRESWKILGFWVELNKAKVLFSFKNFYKMNTVILSFVFDKYCLIIK